MPGGNDCPLRRQVNNTTYGLAAYICSTALYAAERLEAGEVGINVNDITELHARRLRT